MKTILRFLKDEQGLELSEYAVMTGIVLMVAVAAITLIGTNIDTIFDNLGARLGTAALNTGT